MTTMTALTIRAFEVHMPDDDLADLRRRIAAMRWPPKELVAGRAAGDALTDSPAGLAAWMLDHDTDSYQKISRALAGGQPAGGLTRDRILDNITLYWLTGTATSAARMYWESARSAAAAAGHPSDPVLATA